MAFDVPIPDRPQAAAPQAAAQRAAGRARLAVQRDGEISRLSRLYQEGAAKLRLPRSRSGVVEAVMINSAGGMTGGDRFDWAVEARDGAHAVLTTQACERIYRASADVARVDVRLALGEVARIDWLPQETILFEGSALSRRIEADLAPGARLLACEAVILGRHAMGERFTRGLFQDRWRIRREGRLTFADDLTLAGDIPALTAPSALLAGAGAFATLLLVGGDAEARIDAVRAAIGDLGGASAFDGKLVARLAAPDGLSLRRALVPAIAALGAKPPTVWTF
ncbi:urease accessory protein UreD [Caulobacter sp. SLTY]|uniref:urease accessory protein UreD n=1 Tax=Caulobacter sp. SLTY TaxID=2683262 RepID=UPI0014134F21|nr:urease accessory protein UreD [Caulobacter sp. SLTY]NBB14377.1 urease accessory protein UreD [Caulobacter sp. SLTY]